MRSLTSIDPLAASRVRTRRSQASGPTTSDGAILDCARPGHGARHRAPRSIASRPACEARQRRASSGAARQRASVSATRARMTLPGLFDEDPPARQPSGAHPPGWADSQANQVSPRSSENTLGIAGSIPAQPGGATASAVPPARGRLALFGTERPESEPRCRPVALVGASRQSGLIVPALAQVHDVLARATQQQRGLAGRKEIVAVSHAPQPSANHQKRNPSDTVGLDRLPRDRALPAHLALTTCPDGNSANPGNELHSRTATARRRRSLPSMAAPHRRPFLVLHPFRPPADPPRPGARPALAATGATWRSCSALRSRRLAWT